MFKIIKKILLDERGASLSCTYSFSANTLIVASQMNTNMADIEASVNAIDTEQISADAVTAAKLNSDVVRSTYGLIQHTDGSLYVDVSDTSPCLELTDGGLRVKVDASSIERASGGLQVKADGITAAMLGNDLVLETFFLTPSAAPDADYEMANKKYVDDNIDRSPIQAVGTSDISTTSDTFADMTDMTLTLGVGKWLILFSAPFQRDGSATNGLINLVIDSVQKLVSGFGPTSTTYISPGCFQWYENIAGTGIIKVQWKRSPAAGTIYQKGATDGARVLTAIKLN